MEVGPSTVAPAVTAPGLRWIVFFYDNDDQRKDDGIGDNDIFEMKC